MTESGSSYLSDEESFVVVSEEQYAQYPTHDLFNNLVKQGVMVEIYPGVYTFPDSTDHEVIQRREEAHLKLKHDYNKALFKAQEEYAARILQSL